MIDLLKTVGQYVRRNSLLPEAETVVVGVSGGADSLCLLHLLRRLAAERGPHLHVAHLNHGLRAVDSDADARFVADLSQSWGTPCSVGQADVRSLTRDSGLSLEEAARQARYGFLAEVAKAQGARTIAVGHNADDQAETVLMHFLRGSGVTGLRGMLPRTRLADYRIAAAQQRESVPDGTETQLWLVRPLLNTRRVEIEAYCAHHGLWPRFDLSNEDVTFFRNRLRHELLPALERYNPEIRNLLAHTAEVMAGDYETLRSALDAAWEQMILASGPDEVQLDLLRWRASSIGLQRAAVREAIYRLRRNLRNINWEHVERAVWLGREGQTGQLATLTAGLVLRVGYRALRIAAEGAQWLPDVPQIAGLLALRTPGVTSIGNGWRVVVQDLNSCELPRDYDTADAWVAWLDAAAVGPNLSLRPRRPGDRFQPQGLCGHSVALHEFMINAKVPRDARAGWPLLAGEYGIAWVCGLRLDERVMVSDATRNVWQVTFEREPIPPSR
jgi:tRNA(Ile)-lysidine synthase